MGRAGTMVKRMGRIAWVWFCTALILMWLIDLRDPRPAGAAGIDFPPTDYVIRAADGASVIGRVHFSLEPGPGALSTLHGDYRYANGDYDVEDDTVREVPGAVAPLFVRSRHAFFKPDGSPDRIGEANLAAGYGECTVYENGVAHATRAQLVFPPDTYAGASVMIPLRDFLAAGAAGHAVFHVFNCVPDPKIVKVTAQVHHAAPWPYYPGALVRVSLKPDFGWLNLVIGPFLPEIRAWFDPDDGWAFVGGESARYYKGRKIMLVRAYAKTPQLRQGGPTMRAGAPAAPSAEATPNPGPAETPHGVVPAP